MTCRKRGAHAPFARCRLKFGRGVQGCEFLDTPWAEHFSCLQHLSSYNLSRLYWNRFDSVPMRQAAVKQVERG